MHKMWCSAPPAPPTHDQSAIVCFQQGAQEETVGSHQDQGRGEPSRASAQPSIQQAMWPSQCSLTVQIPGSKSANWAHTEALPNPWRVRQPVPYAQFFPSACYPVAASSWILLLTPSPLPQSLPQHEGQGRHSRQGADCSLGLESLHLNRVLSSKLPLEWDMV